MARPIDHSPDTLSSPPQDDGVVRSLPTHHRADAPISEASRRLRSLAALSGSLTDALIPSEAANLVETQALVALGATSAVVVTLGAFPPVPHQAIGTYAPPAPTTLHVVHTVGLPDEIRAALEQVPLDAPVPFAEVAREGQAVYLASASEFTRYPEWGAAMVHVGARAAAIVPVWANGELRGVLGLAWAAPRVFDEDERAFVSTLGILCAQAIMRAHLKAAESDARETAERANRSKARFVATISHELRTPVNAVLGYTSLLADEIYGPVTDLQREHLGRVRLSGTHLMGLIGDLLSYARVEAGEEVVRPEPVLLAEVVEESLTLVRPMALKQGLHIRVELPPTPVPLFTDPRKVRQILVNLLANAVKFSEAGDVVLLVGVQGRNERIRVVFEVRDSGRGISADHLEHVFDPFWQADPTATHSAGSTGLGLSVARQLARLLGGDVVVASSAVGQGSTFVLSLPPRYVAAVHTPRAPVVSPL